MQGFELSRQFPRDVRRNRNSLVGVNGHPTGLGCCPLKEAQTRCNEKNASHASAYEKTEWGVSVGAASLLSPKEHGSQDGEQDIGNGHEVEDARVESTTKPTVRCAVFCHSLAHHALRQSYFAEDQAEPDQGEGAEEVLHVHGYAG